MHSRARGLVALVLAACGPQTMQYDASVDAGFVDSGSVDSGVFDGGVVDAGCGTGLLDLNDVSFLFPLPADPDGGQLLTLNEAGPKGALLPVSLRGPLPNPIAQAPHNTSVDEAVVVGVRVDPCFRAGAGPCRKQLRLVAQPLTADGATDATVHLFYELSDAEFTAVVGRLRVLRSMAGSATHCAPLAVHPVMTREGLDGPYATAVKALVRDYCGAQNLSRVAVMTLSFGIPGWGFSGFDVGTSGLAASTIPRLGTQTFQHFTAQNPGGRFGSFQPPPSDSLVPQLINEAWLADAGTADLTRALDETWRIDNPMQENPGTIDCVSCHIAERARGTSLDVRGTAGTASPNRYSNPRHVMTFAPGLPGLRVQRVFGYMQRTPVLSVRVVNESAEVADALNALP